MTEQYAVIDGDDGIVCVGDYQEAVEWYKSYCDRACDDAMDDGCLPLMSNTLCA